MKTFRAEFHIHTVLSACAAVEMIPPLIIQAAESKGIELIAITDHNASANVDAVRKASKDTSISVLPGMELQTKEEVHTLCIFDDYEQLMVLQDLVNSKMPDFSNDPEHFGEQYIVDETGDFIDSENRLLSTSANITLKDAWEEVTRLGGLFIPAHINRAAYGIMTVLGFLPQDIQPSALEISKHLSIDESRKKYPQIREFPLIQSGDAHSLQDILGWNILFMEKPTIDEIKKALNGIDGRSINIVAN